MPGRCAAPPAPAMITRKPARTRVLRVLEHVVGHAVRGQHARLVGDAEGVELRDGVLHDLPVAVAAHHHARQRCRLALRHPSPLRNAFGPLERNLSIGDSRRRAPGAERYGAGATKRWLTTSTCRRLPASCLLCASRSPTMTRSMRLPSHDVCVAARRARAARGAALAQSDADFLAATRGVRQGRPREARRDRARARPITSSRRTSRTGSCRLGLDDASPRGDPQLPRPLSQHAACRPPARRLAEVARPRGRCGRASAPIMRRRPSDDVELACYDVLYQVAARRRRRARRRACRSGSPARPRPMPASPRSPR